MNYKIDDQCCEINIEELKKYLGIKENKLKALIKKIGAFIVNKRK